MGQAKFVSGSVFRHIVTMSATNAIGITALFVVDLADLFFISLLGEAELAAAVGYAGTIAFFTTSVSIGLSIAMTALVSKAIGQRERERAKRLVINVLFTSLIITSFISALVWLFSPQLLSLIGAKGHTLELAISYIRVLLPSLPVLATAMCAGAALRSVGDAKRSMWSTLAGGGVNAVLDPLFIFSLGLGLQGAALASVVARFVVAGVALHGILSKHDLVGRFRFSEWLEDQKQIFKIAMPAMLTNVATPFGNAYVTAAIAGFGDSYVAGWAVVGRIIPVAFGMIFALSGAIGPIVGQNFGALEFTRVRESLTKACQFSLAYVLVLSLVLALTHPLIISVFGVQGDAAELIAFFCIWISFSFAFNGTLFISNAAFNNLGYPSLSTVMNVAKATIGTLPFVYLGGLWFGAVGVLAGQAIGAALFGVVALVMAYRIVARVENKHLAETQEPEEATELEPTMPMTPFCSSRAYMCAQVELDEKDLAGAAEK